ncbi:MAG: hypothetical protein M0Z75_14990 [Nitrospiraceae bacterium]|nr:hypothetical protein [Nitrospiraceae bacterium]
MDEKRILIIDEQRFSRICYAILSSEGYDTHVPATPEEFIPLLNSGGFHLVITSYPFGNGIMKQAKGLEMPVIILTDQIDWELLQTLELLKNSCCLLKPLDYQKFKDIVKQFCHPDHAERSVYRLI